MMGYSTSTDHKARVPACRKLHVVGVDVQESMGQMLCIAQGARPSLQGGGG